MSDRRRRGPDDDVLDWTIDETPFRALPEFSEPTWNPLPPPAAPSVPVARLGFSMVAVVGVVVLAVWLSRAAVALEREQAVRRVVAAEDQAGLDRDVAALLRLSDPAGGVWLEQRLERVEAGQPVPLPIRLLRPLGLTGRVLAVRELTPGLVLAEVARPYVGPDSWQYRFVLPQFYQQSSDGWRRVPAPEAYWGELEVRTGRYVTLSAHAVDRAFADELLPYLDTQLGRICALLACPPGALLTITLSANSYQRLELPPLRPHDPSLLALLPPVVTRFPDYALLLPSPHDVGYPLDEAGRAVWRRSIAVQALFAAADRAAFGRGTRETVGNAFFLALVARLAVHLELDDPRALAVQLDPIPETLDAEELWGFRFGVWSRPDLVRHALAMLNTWLAGRPAETDGVLLRELEAADSWEAWLTAGLGVTPERAQAMVAAGLRQLRGPERP